LILAAAFFTVVLCTFSFLGVHFGLGIHIWVLSNPFSLPEFLHKSTRITECLYGAYLAYATAITLVKMSLVVSYLRIFPSRSFRRLVFSTGVLIICMWLCSIFSIMFECVPVEAAWNWEEPRARCIDVLAFFYVSSSVNIATDIVIWFAPLPIFWGMNMVTRDRVAICGLFGFGFLFVSPFPLPFPFPFSFYPSPSKLSRQPIPLVRLRPSYTS
jgi:hypothetical protein